MEPLSAKLNQTDPTSFKRACKTFQPEPLRPRFSFQAVFLRNLQGSPERSGVEAGLGAAFATSHEYETDRHDDILLSPRSTQIMASMRI